MREGGARVGRERAVCRVEKREEACIVVDFASFTFVTKEDCFAFKVKRSRSGVGQAQRLKRTPRHVGRRESVHPEHHAQARGGT